MFKNILYFNKDNIIQYNSSLGGKEIFDLDSATVTDDKNISLDIKFAAASKNSNVKYTGSILRNNNVKMYNTFTENLKEYAKDNYIDFLNYDSNTYKMDSVTRNIIIQFESEIKIPENFDIISMFDKFKSIGILNYKMEESLNTLTDKNQKDFLKNLFEYTDIKIPIKMEYDDKLLCGKLNSKYLTCTYEEFENVEEDMLVILARVLCQNTDKSREIFNPLVDWMNMNRSLRKNFNKINMPDGLNKIFAEKNYINIEVLAIYK